MTDVKRALAQLADLDHAELKVRWQGIYGRQPPGGMSRKLLRDDIAYRLQEKTLGRLSTATRRYLERLMDDATQTPRFPTTVRPGTRLLREWHGVTYEVIVLDRGVMFNGKRYGSLSEVARVITGVKWSGPVFFGIRRKRNG